MLTYPDIDPIAISIGPIKVHWYGLMYLIGFVSGWWLARRRAGQPGSTWTQNQVDDLIFYCALGVILGGRIGSILFYSFDEFLRDPVTIFYIWKGGMSFHGGLIGALTAMWIFARFKGKKFFDVGDFAAPLVPIGLGAGRIGNFINGELWGKTTDMPWGFLVNGEVRHPSQLYEAFLEGLVLFVVLWIYSAKPRPTMSVGGLFLFLYGGFRFVVEFVRLPDEHIGYLAFGWLTMGQLLSLPMIGFGAIMVYMAYRGTDSTAKDTAGSKQHETIPELDAARARSRRKKN
jgi:phosphatidylglycerol:prolipoprotein diacylglycerol transferase